MINQEDLEYLFLAYDVNLSGILDKNQMYKLLTDIQYPIPDKNIIENSQLNFENFTRIIGDIQSSKSTDILNPSQICEKMGNKIKLTEFINILAESNEDIDEVIKEYVGEEDEINIKNFIN